MRFLNFPKSFALKTLLINFISPQHRTLMHRYKHLEQSYTHEVSNRKNLSLHNEQLQYKLMQNSGKVAMAINELSKHYPDRADFLKETKASLYGQEINSSAHLLDVGGDYHSKTTSPPSSPVIKGVVEKSDSVSWVVEINDEESAEALASRIVRRVGSFRSNDRHQLLHSQSLTPQHTQQAKKRQLSSSIGGAATGANHHNKEGHALSQSASAASILHQYSEATSPIAQQKHLSASASRLRSKSVSLNNQIGGRDAKKVNRSLSAKDAAADFIDDDDDDEPMWTQTAPAAVSTGNYCSTPKRRDVSLSDLQLSEESEVDGSPKTRTRANSLSEDCDFIPFRRQTASSSSSSTSSYMITCSSSALTTPRSELLLSSTSAVNVAAATAVSVAKDCKKFQQIKESAGEAMVSGQNSEDDDVEDDDEEEPSTAESSDESMSVSSGHTNSSSHKADDDEEVAAVAAVAAAAAHHYPSESVV